MIAAQGVLCPFKDPGRCLLFDEHKDSASKPLIWVRKLLFVGLEPATAMSGSVRGCGSVVELTIERKAQWQ
jgi:hypothetical protein